MVLQRLYAGCRGSTTVHLHRVDSVARGRNDARSRGPHRPVLALQDDHFWLDQSRFWLTQSLVSLRRPGCCSGYLWSADSRRWAGWRDGTLRATTGSRIFSFATVGRPEAVWATSTPGIAMVQTDKSLALVNCTDGSSLPISLPQTVATQILPRSIQFRGSRGTRKMLIGTPASAGYVRY